MNNKQPNKIHALMRPLLAVTTTAGLVFAGVGAGAGAGMMGSLPVVHAATSPSSANKAGAVTDYRFGPVNVEGKQWRRVPYFVSGGTTFFGIWYLQQLLKQYGYTTTWDGRSLTVPSLPDVYPQATLKVNQQPVASGGMLSYDGSTYVDAEAAVTALGGQSTYTAAANYLSIDLPTRPVVMQQARMATTNVTAVFTGSSDGSGPAPTTTPTTTPVTTEEQTLKSSLGAVYEGSELWRTVPIKVYKGTTFFGVWYLQSFLRAHGVTSHWDGTTLTIPNMPQLETVTVQVGTSVKKLPILVWQGKPYIPTSLLSGQGVQTNVDPSTYNVSLTRSLPQLQISGSLVGSGKVTSSGNTTSGNTTSGNTTSGNTTSGNTTSGNTTSGNTTAGEVAVEDASGAVHVINVASDGTFQGSIPTATGAIIGVKTAQNGWTGTVVPVSAKNATGLSLSSTQAMTTLHGKVEFQNSPTYPVQQVSVRNVITQAHYYANVNADGSFTVTVPSGAYEAFAIETDVDSVFLLQSFMATGSTTKVTVEAPVLPSGSTLQTAHATIHANSKDVTPEEMQSVANIFEHIYAGDVARQDIGPKQKVDINLFATMKDYAQHYIDEGYSSSYAKQVSEMSLGSEEGDHTINLLMSSFYTADGINTIAHEFTHALVGEVSTQIPSWASEGNAWTDGVIAQEDGSPSKMLQQGIQWNEWVDIVAHQQAGDILPLGGASSLAGNYNVEAQDYFAVQQLVKNFGWQKFMQYIRLIDTDKNAFADVFGESFDTFSKQVTSVLKADAAKPTGGFTVRLRILPDGPQQIYFINSDGQRFLISGLSAGQTYSFTAHADGSISSPTGTTVTSVSSLPVLVKGDWFIGSGGDGGSNREEFDIVNHYGNPFVDEIALYGPDGSLHHLYPAIAIPSGMEIVSVAPNTTSTGANGS